MRTFVYSNLAVLYIAYSVSQNNFIIPNILGNNTNNSHSNCNNNSNNSNNNSNNNNCQKQNIFIPLSIKTNNHNNYNNHNNNNHNNNYIKQNKTIAPTTCSISNKFN